MSLIYIANMRFPTERAHGKQVREMCNAFVKETAVTLLVPSRKTEGDVNSFGLDASVRLVRIWSPDIVHLGRFGFLIQSVWFAIGASLYARRKQARVITREYTCAALCAFLGISTLWEAHRGEWNFLVSAAYRWGASFIVISHGLESLYLSRGVVRERILVAPDGVDLSRYQHLPSKREAREQLKLPQNLPVVVYNGSLGAWKGADVLVRAAEMLPKSQVLFIGGTDEEIRAFREQHTGKKNVMILGRKPDKERPLYLRAADIAVLPNTAESDISVHYTSPLKLFGYMAAEVPIVASDLPSIREILKDDMAFFARAGDAKSLADTISKILDNPTQGRQRSARSFAVVHTYAWPARAHSILAFQA